jgi:hypothetical protein
MGTFPILFFDTIYNSKNNPYTKHMTEKKAYQPGLWGLTWDQTKLLLISMASFLVSTSFLFYFGNRDGTIRSNWIFALYVVTAIGSYYLYYSMVI